MEFLQWSQEYYEEAQKVLRNIERLKKKLRSCPQDEYRTIERDIQTLRGIYYECLEISSYLKQRAGERDMVA